MPVSFRQLRQFLALSQELHFGRAASRLGISQPPLSASLRQMEERLGFHLMERNSKTVRLTPAGVVFAEHAERILNQVETARAAAAQTAQEATGELTVAFVPSMLFRYFPAKLRAFRDNHPQVKLMLCEMNTSEQVEALRYHRIDVGFVHALPFPESIAHRVIETERLVCCVPRQHRLAARSRIAIKELSGEQVLVVARDYATQYHDRIADLLQAEGIKPNTNFHVRYGFTIIALVAQGMGVSLVPASLARSHLADVAFIEIEERQAEHDVAMIWRQGDKTNPLAAFLTRFGVSEE